MKNKVLKAIKEGNLYDFIANNYLKLSKEELKDILLELDYLMYLKKVDDMPIAEELENRWTYGCYDI